VARDQKVLKFFIRLMLPVVTLGGFGSIAGLLLVFSNTSRVSKAVWSGDKHYRASVIQSFTFDGCGHSSSSFVLVERRNFFFKTGQFTPFCLDGSPDRITLRWKDNQTLAIECSACEENYGYADQNWGKLRFSYDLDKP
jgi:hypothetical protein